jgi:hypothetical protein
MATNEKQIDSKAIEEKAINEVKRFFEDSSIVSTFIAENDKEPFWDGHLYLYPNGIKKNDNFQGRVATQIKGKVLKEAKMNNYTYPVDMPDLKAYLHEGLVFIVVQLVEKQRIIFHRYLSPIVLRDIITKHPENKSVSIRMFPLSNSLNEVELELLQFEIDCKKQISSADSSPINFEDLLKMEIANFSFTLALSEEDRSRPFGDLITSKPIYLYTNINSSTDIQIPIGNDQVFIEFNKEIKNPVSVKSKQFYSSYICKYKKDCTIISISNCMELTISKGANRNIANTNINIKRGACFLKDIIKDTEFILAIADASEITIGKTTIQIPIKEDAFISELRQNINGWKELDTTLCKIGTHEDIDLTNISQKDTQNIELIIRMIGRGEELKLNGKIPSIIKMKISNLSLFLFAYKASSGKSILKNLFDSSLLGIDISDGTFKESIYGLFDRKTIFECSNFPYNNIIPSYEALIDINPRVCERMTLLMLELLSAYDMMSPTLTRKKLALQTANEISDWLIAKDTNEEARKINLINKYQILKRQGKLLDAEKKVLKRLQLENTDSPNLECGIALLLDDSDAFDIYWQKLLDEEHTRFINFPIWIFKK